MHGANASMTKYHTKNKLGSMDPRDLFDNAQNLDDAVNDLEKDTWTDRFGKKRLTLSGQDRRFEGLLNQSSAAFQQFLLDSGYEDLGDYAAGLNIRARNQIFWRDGELYRAGAVLELPYTTTGDWGDDGGWFVVVGDAALRQELSPVLASLRVSDPHVAAGALVLDARVAGMFEVELTEDITDLVLVGATANQRSVVQAVFTQSLARAWAIAVPSNVRMPLGVTEIIPVLPALTVVCRFTSVDGGVSWFYERGESYRVSGAVPFPSIFDDNSTFNDEGDSLAGWTGTNAAPSISSGYVRMTKVSESENAFLSKPIVFPQAHSDYILYGKVKAHPSGPTGFWFLSGAKEVSLWFGINDGGTYEPGAITLVGTTGTDTSHHALVATNVDYSVTPVEFALQFDNKFKTLTCWFRESSGHWKFKARVACDWFSAPNIDFFAGTDAVAGAWIEFDYLTLCRPNIAMLSDSIGEGKPSFSPNPALSLWNDETTWMRHALLYPERRNNLIVNKGVGGQTSAEILSRTNDVTSIGARVVFLHASSNDEIVDMPLEARATNVQFTIDQIVASGASAILLNASYGTKAGSDNTPPRQLKNYAQQSWVNSLSAATGAYAHIDIMLPVADGEGYLSVSMAADGIHPNIAGYTEIGQYIYRLSR